RSCPWSWWRFAVRSGGTELLLRHRVGCDHPAPPPVILRLPLVILSAAKDQPPCPPFAAPTRHDLASRRPRLALSAPHIPSLRAAPAGQRPPYLTQAVDDPPAPGPEATRLSPPTPLSCAPGRIPARSRLQP